VIIPLASAIVLGDFANNLLITKMVILPSLPSLISVATTPCFQLLSTSLFSPFK